MTRIIPTLLCGGSGTRLRPLLRSLYPKQFMEINGRTLPGDSRGLLHEDQSTSIPQGTPHRLGNPGKIPLVIIKTRTGSSLGKGGVLCMEDHSGRTTVAEPHRGDSKKKHASGKPGRTGRRGRK